MPGTRASDSDRLICSWPRWIWSPVTVSIATGRSNARSALRVAETTTGSSCAGTVCWATAMLATPPANRAAPNLPRQSTVFERERAARSIVSFPGERHGKSRPTEDMKRNRVA